MGKSCVAWKPLKKDVLTVAIKAGEQIGTLTASLEQAEKEPCQLKRKDVATKELGDQREGWERIAYERNELQDKLQRAQRERKKCADGASCVQGGVSELQELVKNDSAVFQRHMEDH